jgi:ABC-2 type transport system permease protein
MSSSTLQRTASVSGMLAWRSLILVRRMPSVFIPSLVMPLFILVATSGAFHGISALPIGTGSYLAFTLPFATVMGGGFAGINAGMTLARDIEGGFVDRLISSPAPRLSLVAGPFTAAAMRSIFTTTVVLIAGTLGGIVPPGLTGTVAIYLLAAFFAMSTACWSMGVALRARTVQAAPLMQLVVFVLVFTSVAYAPRSLQTGWLRHVADWNPVTRILEASRAAEFETLSWGLLWPAIISIAILLGVLGVFALHGLAKLGKD